MPDKKERRARSTFYFNGKQYEATGKTQKEAIRAAALKRDKLERGEQGISGNMTVRSWANKWLETYKKGSVGAGQYYIYVRIIGLVTSAIGDVALKNVTDIHLQEILNGRAGKSKHELLKLRMYMKAMFYRAYKSRLITYNPADELFLPAAVAGTHRNITDHERVHILKEAETHYAGLWVKLILYSGMRPGETRALDWRHIDFDKKLIRVREAMKSGTTTIDVPKSSDGVRDIPINKKLLPCLIKAKGDPNAPVFTKPLNGKRHDAKSMNDMWNNFKRQLDIGMGAVVYRNQIIKSVVAEDLVPYCLRHTFCSDLEEAGVPINVARYLMGHSDIKLTSKIYTHTTERTIQNAATMINDEGTTKKRGKKRRTKIYKTME
jgi:integrase